MGEKPTTTNKIIACCLMILALILGLATFFYVLQSNSGMATAMATMVLVVITGFYAWNTYLQVETMKDQTDKTVGAMNNQVTAINQQAIIMQNIENQRNMHEKKLKMQQVYTQLDSAKNEFMDLFMSLAQTQLDCVRLGFITASYRNNTDLIQTKRIEDEYYRRRQLSDSLIIEVTKSSARLIKILSLTRFYFDDVPGINEPINRIIGWLYDIKRKTDEAEGKLDSKLKDLGLPSNISGEDLTKETMNVMETQSENLSNLLRTNIVSEIDRMMTLMKEKI